MADPENNDGKTLLNVGIYLEVETAWYTRRLQSLA